MNSNNPSNVIDIFQAENLLSGSKILQDIEKTKTSLKYNSDGVLVSYDDMYFRLQDMVDALPKLGLQLDIAPGTEQQYSIQLVTAMEQITDDSDRVLRRIIKFEASLTNVRQRIRDLGTGFTAWYALAASQMTSSYKIKFAAAQIKDLAESEFTRLIDNTDIHMDTLLIQVNVLKWQIKAHKKTQREKYEMGEDQVSASWTSHIPTFRGGDGIAPSRSDQLLHEAEPEEWEELPAFISKSKPSKEERLEANPALIQAKNPEPKFIGTVKLNPDGSTPILVSDKITLRQDPNNPDSFIHDAPLPGQAYTYNVDDSAVLPEVKGTFKKLGDAKPVTEIYNDDDGGALKSMPTEVKVEATKKPRKKLGLMADIPQSWYESRMNIEEPGGVMACSPEILAASGGDPDNQAAILDTVLSAVELEAALNEPEALVTSTPPTPRKRLQILTEDEVI